jgi:hypothetical protein
MLSDRQVEAVVIVMVLLIHLMRVVILVCCRLKGNPLLLLSCCYYSSMNSALHLPLPLGCFHHDVPGKESTERDRSLK